MTNVKTSSHKKEKRTRLDVTKAKIVDKKSRSLGSPPRPVPQITQTQTIQSQSPPALLGVSCNLRLLCDIMNLSKDFTLGSLVVMGVGIAYKIWQLLQAPSISAIEGKCQKAMNKVGGDDDKVTIWGFKLVGESRHWKDGVSDGLCYVSRLEAYL